jgi:predicted DNA-binding ribbon-helix-helix protein
MVTSIRIISVPKPGYVTVAWDVYGPRWWELSKIADRRGVSVSDLLEEFINSNTADVPVFEHRDFSNDTRSRVAQALEERARRHEEILNLKAKSWTYREIGKRVDMSVGAVRNVCVDDRNRDHPGYSGNLTKGTYR